jgi:hypothetical protein
MDRVANTCSNFEETIESNEDGFAGGIKRLRLRSEERLKGGVRI